MASQLLPLSSTEHLTHGWARYTNCLFAAQDAWAPLVLAELPAVLPFYTLAFAARPGGGGQLVVIQGLHAGENLYVSAAGQWHVGYIPSCYRGYPFALREVIRDEKRTAVLCFDHASGLYRETPNPSLKEERFFDEQGQLQPLMQQLLSFLGQTHTNRELSNRAVNALESAGLLTPWELPVNNPDPERPLVQGLYCINESKLNALDGQTLETLRNANALAVAYAQVLSIPRLGLLQRLYQQRASQPVQKPVVSLDELFGGGDDDILTFN